MRRGICSFACRLRHYSEKRLQKRLSRFFQLPLQPLRAIAITASPRFRTILIPAFPAIMRVLYPGQFEVFLPIRTFFLQRRGAVTDLYPTSRIVGAQPCLPHISQVLALSDRASAQVASLDCFQQTLFATALHSRPDQITHELYSNSPESVGTFPGPSWQRQLGPRTAC